MRKKHIMDMDPDRKDEAIKQIMTILAGSREEMFTQSCADNEFNDLRSSMTDAIGKAEDKAGSRMEAIYKITLFRDTTYATAGRKYMMALAMHNKMRGLYGIGKHAVDI